MKICQLCAVDFTMAHFLLPLMRGMREAGHDVVGVCADGPLLTQVREAGFDVITVPFRRGYNPMHHWLAYRALVRLFRRQRFDLLHVHTPIAALIARIAARQAGVPRVVYTAHGFYFHERMRPWTRALFILLEWIGGRFTDVLFTQAEEDAAAARRFRLCRGGVIEAIGNGSDPSRFHPPEPDDTDRQRLRAEWRADPQDTVILTVGRLVAEKGYPELFRAMREVGGKLWVAGERLASDHAGSVASDIAAIRSDRTLSARIAFLGYRADVDRLMRAADIFVLASHREGMPRSIIEAMLSGLPVVATDIRGSREEVVDGETGILVPVGDETALAAALNRLADSTEKRTEMGAAGLDRARSHYDEATVVERQIELLGLDHRPEGS